MGKGVSYCRRVCSPRALRDFFSNDRDKWLSAVFKDRPIENINNSKININKISNNSWLSEEDIQYLVSLKDKIIDTNQNSKNIFNSNYSFLDTIDLIQLSFFLGFFNKDEIYKTHNRLLTISNKFPKISDVRNLGSFERIQEVKSVGKSQVVLLSNIFKKLHNDIDSLIEFLEKSKEVYIDKIHCSNNLKLFLRLNDINSVEDLIKFLKSIDMALLSDYEKLGLFELLNLSCEKEGYKTNSTFISENDSIFQENFIESFKELLKDKDKEIFELRFQKKITLTELGLKLDLTRERVRQLINKYSVCFKNIYFIESLEHLTLYLKELTISKRKPLTVEDLNIISNIIFYSLLFKIIPFEGLIKTSGSSSERGKRIKILSDFGDFNVTIDDLSLIDFQLVNDVFYSEIYKFDDDGFLYKNFKVTTALDFIIKSIQKPTTINEFRSIFYSNSIFNDVIKKNNLFGNHFPSQIAQNNNSVLIDSKGQSLDDHIYGRISMLSYEKDIIKEIHAFAYKILKSKGHPMSGGDLYKLIISEFPDIISKYELAVILKLNSKFIYTHRARAFIFSIKEHGDVKEVQEHFEDILKEFNHVVHVSDVINKLKDRCSFREEGLSSVKRRNKNIILWGASYYGLLQNMDSDREILKKNIEYINKIIDVPKREKYFKLLFPDKKFTEINIGELIDGC